MSSIHLIIVLSLGIFLGFVLQYLSSSPEPTKQKTEQTQALPAKQTDFSSSSPAQTPISKPGSTALSTHDINLLEPGFEQTAVIYALVSQSNKTKILSQIAEVATFPPRSQRAFQQILYSRFADLDPQAALAHALEQGSGFPRASLTAIFLTWSYNDLYAAVDQVTKLDKISAAYVSQRLLLARSDLSTADRKDIAEKMHVTHLLPYIDALQIAEATGDPAESWKQAMLNSKPKGPLLHSIIQQWAKTDPKAALLATQELENPKLREQLNNTILRNWGQSDPVQAIEWALFQPDKKIQATLLTHSLRALATNKPIEALAIADSLPDEIQLNAYTSVFQSWASQDALAAASWLSSSAEAVYSEKIVTMVARQLARNYPNEAIEWVSTLPSNLSLLATAQVANVIGLAQPELAASLLAPLGDERAKRRSESTLARQWAKTNPEAAMDWAESSNSKGNLYAQIMDTWSRYGYEKPLDYLNGMAQSSEKDQATTAILRHVTDDAALARRLYESIQNPSHKRRAAQQLYSVWKTRDPELANWYRKESATRKRRRGETQLQSG